MLPPQGSQSRAYNRTKTLPNCKSAQHRQIITMIHSPGWLVLLSFPEGIIEICLEDKRFSLKSAQCTNISCFLPAPNIKRFNYVSSYVPQLQLCVSVILQAGQVQDPADLSDSVGGVWGAGVRLSVPFHLHRHALLPGCCQRRGLPNSVHRP